MKKIILTFLCSFAIMATVNLANAAICMKHDAFVATIENEHKEQLLFMALTDTEPVFIIETYTNPENLSWTMIATGIDGISCLMSYGKNFELNNLPPKPNL